MAVSSAATSTLVVKAEEIPQYVYKGRGSSVSLTKALVVADETDITIWQIPLVCKKEPYAYSAHATKGEGASQASE